MVRLQHVLLVVSAAAWTFLFIWRSSPSPLQSSTSSVQNRTTVIVSPAPSAPYCALNWIECAVLVLRPYGRLGNNVIQLHNALTYTAQCGGAVVAEALSPNLAVPSIIFPRKYTAAEEERIMRECLVMNVSAEIYRSNRVILGRQCSCPVPHSYSETLWTLLRPISREAWTENMTDTLVLHMRGGDVFRANQPSARYAQPPCSYYARAIEHAKASRVLLATEDFKNPCVNATLQRYPSVQLLLRSVTDTALLFLRAKKLVLATSSFSVQMANSSPLMEVVYTTDDVRPSRTAAHCYINYNKAGLFPWRASPEQMHLLLTIPSDPPDCRAGGTEKLHGWP